MADQANEDTAQAAAESEIGRDVLYVMTDGKTVRPAKILLVESVREGEKSPRATLSIFTAGKSDRGLIEHHERNGVYEGTGQEPSVIVRDGVPYAGELVDGAWPAHSFHASSVVRVSATARTERPPEPASSSSSTPATE